MEPLSANDPQAVGEYRLRARLGAGGMGRVYLGYSLAGRAVAVKVVHPQLARDPAFARRFAREVAAARVVSGMYTAPVVAAGLDDDPQWLATAFVPGPSLAEFVARYGPLPETAVWRLAAGLTEALRAVHGCGLIHRDLKPANVLLAEDGPHLIDFGISRALDGTSLTVTGMVVGTPGYMSPEQAEGAQTGPASDVFSLGSVLGYAATGSAPFGGGSAAAVLYRVVTAQPDLAGVSGPLRELIAGCLAKDPARRPGLAALATMISQACPAPRVSPSSYWPAPMARVIRASQAGTVWDAETRAPTAATRPAAPPPTAPRPDAYARPYPGRYPRPRPAATLAARLMYAGAAVSLLNMIVALAAIGQIKASFLARHPLMPAGAVQSVDAAATGLVAAGGLVVVALWLWLASGARQGRSWVRPAGTALFAMDTLALLGTISDPDIVATKSLGVVIWLIGLLAVVALWRRRPDGPA